jgi:D-aspartate ligase
MNDSNESFSVLIPDGDSSLFGSVLNCLSKVKDVHLFVMSEKKDHAFRYSRFIKGFFYFPPASDELEWLARIDMVVEEHQIDVIMPIWETAIKTILEHKDLLRSREKLVPLPTLQHFMIASSKDLLAEHLERHGIPGAKTIPLSFDALADRDTFKLQFPLLAKPLISGGGKGIVKFQDFDSLATYFKTKGINQSYILQEFITGEDYGCNVLCQDGEVLAFTMQKGNLWDPAKPYSYQIGLDFVYHEKMYQTVKSLMKSLHWNGIADLDLLYHRESDTFYIVEINPRFWGTLLAALMAGINYPHLWVLLAKKKNIPAQSYKRIPYVNLRGLEILLKKDKSLLLRPAFIWNNSPLKFKFDDPVRILRRLFLNLKHTVSGKFKSPDP